MPEKTQLKILQQEQQYFWTMPYPRRAPGRTDTTVEDVAYVNLPDYPHGYPGMHRPFHVLLITVNGNPVFTHHGKSIPIHRGGVSLYGYGEDYAIDTGQWEAFTFHFHPSETMRALLDAANVPASYSWNGVIGEEMLAQYQEIFGYPEMDEVVSHYRAAILVEQTLLALLRHLEGVVQPPRTMRLQDLKHYLDLNPTPPHTLAGLAQMVNLSPSRFAHLFTQEYGVPVYTYITRVRMERAQMLLRTTDLPASAIGQQVGYADPRHFYTVFKRVVGMTPKVYRRSG